VQLIVMSIRDSVRLQQRAEPLDAPFDFLVSSKDLLDGVTNNNFDAVKRVISQSQGKQTTKRSPLLMLLEEKDSNGNSKKKQV
jgi:hypothetical protein